MKTLILKTEGLSAYGLQTFDVHRKVNHFPTRSAILGMLGAALGITRARHNELAALSQQITVAVQVNQCGEKMLDYQTVQNFRSPHGKIQKGQTKPSYREYWCDSEHTFAITAASDVIDRLAAKVQAPEFTVFQGRKSCPLTRPLFETIVADDNPANALITLGSPGQIFSDVSGNHPVATIQVRDLTTRSPRKYAMRTVHVCGKKTVDNQLAAGSGGLNESA
ncbi:type I-E CRISPR-associated protein Cas5/CasD [Endozoicomonas montiporae]|uniref:CRISPR-associated Cas5 family protein n=1 Tax=Endozoicomonas montiporae CL-33 TaxID=570277 RepID=A0A142BG58_9GAMM|nr:type I-E CRISPR-associated protein Cas5/CasD [Endozoicomonas montiporae]AMO57734.1 CRISPR-associated Cas5 family protein [Endozoicomonas montiporae CL-33]